MLIADIARILFGLLAVIAMIGLCALAARKLGLASASGGFVRKRRLSLVETLALDGRRRIAIVKCDAQEHLIVLGPTGETVIAKDIPAPTLEATPSDPVPENPFSFAAHFANRFGAAKDAA